MKYKIEDFLLCLGILNQKEVILIKPSTTWCVAHTVCLPQSGCGPLLLKQTSTLPTEPHKQYKSIIGFCK